MAIYFVTILGLTGFGYLTAEKKKKYYLAAVFVSFVFLTSFRYAIGFDFLTGIFIKALQNGHFAISCIFIGMSRFFL